MCPGLCNPGGALYSTGFYIRASYGPTFTIVGTDAGEVATRFTTLKEKPTRKRALVYRKRSGSMSGWFDRVTHFVCLRYKAVFSTITSVNCIITTMHSQLYRRFLVQIDDLIVIHILVNSIFRNQWGQATFVECDVCEMWCLLHIPLSEPSFFYFLRTIFFTTKRRKIRFSSMHCENAFLNAELHNNIAL